MKKFPIKMATIFFKYDSFNCGKEPKGFVKRHMFPINQNINKCEVISLGIHMVSAK